MTTFMTFTVLGLVLGCVYAIAASGLVLTYNTSGIFNFAHGAQAMLGAFTYFQVHNVWGVPALPAVILVLGILGPLMGFLLHRVIMRGLRDTAEVTRIVVTVAVMLGMLGLSRWFWAPEEPRNPELFFGAKAKIDIGGVPIRYHEIICILAAIGLAIGLRILFTRTRAGVLMRGAVDDPDLLRLNGHDPERVGALSWTLGSTLAVVAGILIPPLSGSTLDANSLTLLVIDAFAAAMFGRLRSIPRTFVGAIILGLAGTYLVAYAPTGEQWVTNVRVALPMLVLFAVLIALPQDRLRGAAVRSRERYRVPSVRRAVGWGIAFVIIVELVRLLIDPANIGQISLGLCFAVMALSLTLLTGYAGELNLAPVSFGAVATVVAFHQGIVGTGLDARMTIGGLIFGVLAAAFTGALVALPALRLRGLYLALATMAFGVMFSALVLRDTTEHTWFGKTFTVFPTGSLLIPALKVGPLDLADPVTFLRTVSVIFAVVAIGVVSLRNSGMGRRLAAMKDSPAASAMLGQRLIMLKLIVFMMSTAIAGLGGVLMSMALTSVAAENFHIMVSLSLVMLTVVGGIGYVSGALFGGLFAGIGFTITVGAFNDLSLEHPEYADTFSILANLIVVMTATIGIGVAQNPSGFLHEQFHIYRELMAKARPVVYAGLVIQAVLYVLDYLNIGIGTWMFSFLSILLWLLLPAIAPRFFPDLLTAEQRAAGATPPPELQGIETAYDHQLIRELDKELGLPIVNLPPQRKESVDATA